MKKLFNHTKRPVEDWKGYDENDYDWDESDYDSYEGDGEDYEDEAFLLEEEEFIERESCYDIEEQENVMQESFGEEGYVEEPEAYAEEGYAEEPEAYAEEGYAEEPEAYAEEGYAEEPEAYAEEGYAEEPEYYVAEGLTEEEAGYLEENFCPETEYNGKARALEEVGQYGKEFCGEAGTYEEPEYYEEEEYRGEAGTRGEIEYYEEEDRGEEETRGEIEYYEEEEYRGEAGTCEEIEYYEEEQPYGGSEYYGEEQPYGGFEYQGEVQPSGGLEYHGEAVSYGEPGYYEEEQPYGDPELYGETSPYGEPESYGETSASGGLESYEEAVSHEEPGYYEEEAPYEEPRHYKEKKPIFDKQRQGLGGIEIMDKVILGTGAAVLILAIVIGGIFFRSKIMEGQVADFAGVGSQLDGINMIGERGLLAVADAELARMAAAEAVREQETEPPKEYNEADYEKDITVSLSLTSVQKDLKIKFINSSNGKLISNVPFTVTVTDANGKSVIWTDDDMDGIIYKKDIVPGNYTVVMQLLADEQYSDYTISETPQKVEVKKDIDYKKVDVSNEIKKESEVNAAKEDTKQNVTVVESTLPDTIEWVESKVIESTYNEISKSSIPDPATLVSAASGRSLINVAEVQATVSGNLPMQGSLVLDRTEVTLLTETTAVVNAVLTGITTAAPAVTAASADPNIALVSAAGTVVTVTGINAGSTAVTVSYVENGQALTQNFQVTVKSHPKGDYETKLRDAEGNQLFVLENDVYREAVYADYYTADKFFVKGGAKYSGWQTLDGKVYYFTAGGEIVTGEQVIQGARYNFASDGSLVTGSGTMGIDVSKWNGNIDWNAVSNSGISYVIIRCGYRGSSQGKLIEDPKFLANIKGATAAGLKVGVYFFTQAVDEVEAVEEASMVLEQIKGYKISYPIFLDVEPSGGRADSVDRATRTAICKAFCETIQDAGYTAGIYANKTWLTDKLNADELNQYKIWLAQYSATPTYTGKYDIWQYKSNGSVSGIKGNVDMNQSYLGY